MFSFKFKIGYSCSQVYWKMIQDDKMNVSLVRCSSKQNIFVQQRLTKISMMIYYIVESQY